ncbi:hypothetical protein D3C71_1235350 [compost metagenome]
MFSPWSPKAYSNPIPPANNPNPSKPPPLTFGILPSNPLAAAASAPAAPLLAAALAAPAATSSAAPAAPRAAPPNILFFAFEANEVTPFAPAANTPVPLKAIAAINA